MAAGEFSQKIIDLLSGCYGSPECALHFETPFQLLIAVILSAQCTDKRVNLVTPKLFEAAGTPQEMCGLSKEQLIGYIRSCGFYNNKAENILKCSRDIITRFGGEVPKTKDELVTLAGVGNKTANVVYAVAFGGQAIPVDTHVGRLARRLGLSKHTNPDKVEADLCGKVEYNHRTLFHHLLITHGRTICKSRKPQCEVCALNAICPKII